MGVRGEKAGAPGAVRVARAGLAAGLLLITALALWLRWPELDVRPMHGDEAVHAAKLGELWQTGVYRYDPNEFHGPTLYYATLPVLRAARVRGYAEATERHYRTTTVIFGAAMVPLLFLLADGLGVWAALWAALFLAASPAFVFYSRYYIQETLLVCFTLGMLGAGWRYARSQRLGWAVAAGAFAGLMVATKETAVATFAAAAVGLAVCGALGRRAVGGKSAGSGTRATVGHAAAAVGAAVVVACLFLSGFLTHPAGPLDYIRSYTPWLRRAGGTDLHQHGWHYYLSLLLYTHRGQGPVWTEALIVGLAVVGGVAAWVPRGAGGSPGLPRFLSLYTLALTAIYSAIPYKTPWCVLSFLQGMILLAGVGAATLVRWAPGRLLRALTCLALAAGVVHLGWQGFQLSTAYATDGRNPYVYAQTVPDVLDLADRVEGLARVSPQKEATVVQVIAADEYYWPIPWYLRRLTHVGYWTGLPETLAAPIIVASDRYEKELARRLGSAYRMSGYYGLRPEVFFQVWVRQDLWDAFLRTRQ